ncbi:hypothetical protein EJ05DRAFT_535420 [Pseudovirgaria hyperparasitica]|uniref:Signal recognition particle subunit SRP68 n=1 Tax=Pseudovirgaria hyperparasitica TaxID=470096 RepID=A0A6A6WH70_9PEZI|nr:uncharacterized protein EJ05DRAFT_535420 [Pseudovirgaria hyperparasitica]KAF2762153.1 hypothetical protein EJ05DRAFT_535420 [Pseudovirgaria hyperparasitica]
MEITHFVTSQRDNALLIGDYNTYRAQLARRIRTLRKKLGRATPKNVKYSKKAPITAGDVQSNQEFVHLLLLSSERAWAHAMYMKAAHAEDNTEQGITGSTRKHIISRLHKASKIANDLLVLLGDQLTGAVERDRLEAQAYASSLSGAEEFEKQSEGIKDSEASVDRWQPCLHHFATARVIYNALLKSTRDDTYKEVLVGSIDPSIRYAAYSSSIPRTVAVSTVAIKYFPQDRLSGIVPAIEELDPEALVDPSSNTANTAATDVPNTITWRGRKANIIDAAIGQALASVAIAETELSQFLTSATEDTTSREKGGAYDGILIASQDAVDATRHAIEELEKEGVEEGDSRMQNLRVTNLAVNYDLIGWRIGRNRVLIGIDDGASFDSNENQRQPKRPRKDGKQWTVKPEGNGRRLARLRERVVLLDAILQSIDSVKELRGAARDTAFIDELDAKRAYYQALKCLNIAQSHMLLSTPSSARSALALLDRALTLSTQSKSHNASPASSIPRLDPSSTHLETLHSRLSALVIRHRALVHLQTLTSSSATSGRSLRPLVDSLDIYPVGGANLSNLVTYPPKLQPIPVKPLFLDVAFNYIVYPGQGAVKAVEERAEEGKMEVEQDQTPKKRGWFGFGR